MDFNHLLRGSHQYFANIKTESFHYRSKNLKASVSYAYQTVDFSLVLIENSPLFYALHLVSLTLTPNYSFRWSVQLTAHTH